MKDDFLFSFIKSHASGADTSVQSIYMDFYLAKENVNISPSLCLVKFLTISAILKQMRCRTDDRSTAPRSSQDSQSKISFKALVHT